MEFACKGGYGVKIRDVHLRYETGETLASNETYYSVKRDLLQCKRRVKIRDVHLRYETGETLASNETYYSVKRDPLQCKR